MKTKSLLLTMPLLALVSFEACKKKTETPKLPVPVADFNYTGADVKAPAAVVFENTSTYAETYLWEFGDGDTSTAKNPSHTYEAGGSYSVKLTAKGQGGEHSVTKTLNVLPAPTGCAIQSISVTAMPFADPNGAGWDLLDGPDVCYKITNSNGDVLVDGSSSRFDNTGSSNLPRNWTLGTPHNITPLNTNRNIQILDYDMFDPSDLIGSVPFNPYLYRGTYPTTVILTNKDLTVKLNLTWQ
jgi:PKD repeat protein